MTAEERVETTAAEFQAHVRGLAGLKSDWIKTPETMREWYRRMARRIEGIDK